MTIALVLDIEGTTSPAASVHETLFSYVHQRLPGWLADNRTAEVDRIVDAVRRDAGEPDADLASVGRILQSWLAANVKNPQLKAVQGMVGAEGFASGALHGEFFPDVAPALRRWRSAGLRVHVYSSGSERNQRDWFAFARGGALSDLVEGHFDLATAGGKREADSYRRVATAIDVPPEEIMFLTDSPAELAAAAEAGWRVLGVARPGEEQGPEPPWEWVGSFDEVDAHLSPAPRSTPGRPS